MQITKKALVLTLILSFSMSLALTFTSPLSAAEKTIKKIKEETKISTDAQMKEPPKKTLELQEPKEIPPLEINYPELTFPEKTSRDFRAGLIASTPLFWNMTASYIWTPKTETVLDIGFLPAFNAMMVRETYRVYGGNANDVDLMRRIIKNSLVLQLGQNFYPFETLPRFFLGFAYNVWISGTTETSLEIIEAVLGSSLPASGQNTDYFLNAIVHNVAVKAGYRFDIGKHVDFLLGFTCNRILGTDMEMKRQSGTADAEMQTVMDNLESYLHDKFQSYGTTFSIDAGFTYRF